MNLILIIIYVRNKRYQLTQRINPMRRLILTTATVAVAICLAFAAEPDDDGQDSAVANVIKHIPAGYRFVEGERGDLNKDGIDDYVVLIKATDKKKIVRDDLGNLVDLNRRGIMVFLSNGGNYKLALENRQCFLSEKEAGGNYFPPGMWFHIDKGNLLIQYTHYKKGIWEFTFRYRNSDFELIGYDWVDFFYSKKRISFNFSTKKQLTKVCSDKNCDTGCNECKTFKETWNDIIIKEPTTLRKIVTLDEFDIDAYISKK
jgi:hypothetical protein